MPTDQLDRPTQTQMQHKFLILNEANRFSGRHVLPAGRSHRLLRLANKAKRTSRKWWCLRKLFSFTKTSATFRCRPTPPHARFWLDKQTDENSSAWLDTLVVRKKSWSKLILNAINHKQSFSLVATKKYGKEKEKTICLNERNLKFKANFN